MHPEVYRLLSMRDVTERTSLSEATVRRLVDANQFARPVKLSRNRVAWREPDVTAWITSRVETA